MISQEQYATIYSTLQRVEQKLDTFQGLVRNTMTQEDIKRELGINSSSTFERRIPKLTQYGMRKDGKNWIMKKSDFERYLNAL